MIYELRIWFRFMVNGDQEKDFEHYSIEALNVHEAFKLIKADKFKTNAIIPISYQRFINGVSDGNVYKPSHVEMDDINFQNPLSNINKEYN